MPRMGAGCLALIGMSVVVMAAVLYFGKGRLDLLGAAFYAMLGAGFLGAGVYWYRYVVSQERARRRLFQEKAILAVAARHGGRATLALVTLETNCTAADAESAMARLRREGFAVVELLDDGTVCYRFGGLIAE